MTPFAKFFLIIAIVGGGAYFSAPYIQAYTNPDGANPPQNPFKFLTQKSAPKLNNKHVIFLHTVDGNGKITLRNRLLSKQELKQVDKDDYFSKETLIGYIETGTVVELIQEHDNAFEIKTKSGEIGFIIKKYREVRTLIKLRE